MAQLSAGDIPSWDTEDHGALLAQPASLLEALNVYGQGRLTCQS